MVKIRRGKAMKEVNGKKYVLIATCDGENFKMYK